MGISKRIRIMMIEFIGVWMNTSLNLFQQLKSFVKMNECCDKYLMKIDLKCIKKHS